MFPNLEAEMARKKISQTKIKREVFPDQTVDYLFATESE